MKCVHAISRINDFRPIFYIFVPHRTFVSFSGVRRSDNKDKFTKIFDVQDNSPKNKSESKKEENIDLVDIFSGNITQKTKKEETQRDYFKNLISILSKDDDTKPPTATTDVPGDNVQVPFFAEELSTRDIIDSLFGEKSIDLKYWTLYPKQIKKWIIFTKSDKGLYNKVGKWTPVNAFEELLSKDVVEEGKDKDKEKVFKEKFEDVFLQQQETLPTDLRGHFRFGVTYDEIKDFHPKLKRLFSFNNASKHEIIKHRKQLAIKKWGTHETDTASDAVQVDVLTLRIRSLEGHLKNNKQDKKNMRSLSMLTKRRKSLLIRIKKKNIPLYFALLKDLNLKDKYPAWNMVVH